MPEKKMSRSHVVPILKRSPPLKAGEQGAVRQLDAQTSAVHVDDVVPAAEIKRLNDEPVENAAEHSASNGKVSPGKNVGQGGDKVTSFAHYVSSIGDYLGLTAMMEVARLCVEASNRLTAAQKLELIAKLPFGETTFSKLIQIGTDSRLHTPVVQRLLPADFTTIHAVALLKDEELSIAIAEKVIHPGMKRPELRRWCNSRRETVGVAPSPNEAASDSAVASLPIVPARDGVDRRVVRSALSQHETQDSLDAQDGCQHRRG
jgi:hypothetical protein